MSYNKCFDKAKSCRKSSKHFQTCSAIGLMTLLITWRRKIPSITSKIEMLQALDCWLQGKIELLIF